MTYTDNANALIPGDWSALRDLMRDLAAEIDNMKITEDPVIMVRIEILQEQVNNLEIQVDELEEQIKAT